MREEKKKKKDEKILFSLKINLVALFFFWARDSIIIIIREKLAEILV